MRRFWKEGRHNMPGTFIVVQLLFLALSHVLAVPSFPPAPLGLGHGPLISAAPTTELDPFVRAADSQIRSRKIMQAPAPQRIDPMEKPTREMRIRREPNAIEEALIQDYIAYHRNGQSYVMDSHGLFSGIHKPCWTLKYCCGKTAVIGHTGRLSLTPTAPSAVCHGASSAALFSPCWPLHYTARLDVSVFNWAE
ncbi:putative signal peptide protein [Puccinia sorghi]|uniref:Putative signal peptide protein n=1 Tax=Puccinia sorghi TaxID=27349 RepID=A0A0L6URZ3_9BASI|nr:putative signal peptide protein [Puccinia sorghi]